MCNSNCISCARLRWTYGCCFLKPNNQTCVENNTSYKGNDIKHFENVESWLKCSELCRGVAECSFWTWIAPDAACYLKHKDSGRTHVLHGVSGARTCAAHLCDFSFGTGVGGSFRKIGEQKESACVDACLHTKVIDPSINGVTVYSGRTKRACYCKSNMTSIATNMQ